MLQGHTAVFMVSVRGVNQINEVIVYNDIILPVN